MFLSRLHAPAMLQAELEEAQRKLETLKAEMMADIYLPRPPDKTTTPEAHFAAGNEH